LDAGKVAATRLRVKFSGALAFSALLLIGVASACNQTAAVNTSYIPISSGLIVSPSLFSDGVPCGPAPGAMKVYRATLFNVTEEEETRHAVSGLISCDRDALFEGVTVGDRYVAEVEAFDADDLTVRSGKVLDDDGDVVQPTWTTRCEGSRSAGEGGTGGEASEIGVYAYRESRLFVDGCAALSRNTSAGPTGARFRFGDAFPGVDCLSEDGGATSFAVSPTEGNSDDSSADASFGGVGGTGGESGEEPEASSASCDEAIVLEDLAPDRTYSFSVEAFRAQETEAAWTAACRVRTTLGVVASPECDAFQATSDE
jgi:hypothetical protein